MQMDLEGFEAYLKEGRLAWERQRPYVVRWPRRPQGSHNVYQQAIPMPIAFSHRGRLLVSAGFYP